ncbi:nucleic acid/nucleotide deaminase domain-containing protein [Kitasatospora terrestris]|uniref:Nucleic acid/nucleotide deaminase of polymorphic system toxin n=1 Tax=Kitasatospora terrestris TaxID=258051 RepID=A0ABP9DT24_9ACTN
MTDIKHDFDAAETLARNFDTHFDRMREHHTRTTRNRTRSVSGRHTNDPMGKIVSDMADRALGAIETALSGLAQHAKDTGAGIRRMSQNHKDLEAKLADHYKRIVNKHDTTPVYLLDHKGDVHRVHPDGSKTKIDDENDSGIKHFFKNGRSELFRVTKADVPPQDAKRTGSRKVRPGGSELARATQRARLAQRDYGSYGPDSQARANYAALHYQDGERNFILVARSDFLNNAHSERRIGHPILDRMQGPNVRSLYSERAPCDSKLSNCGSWLHAKFPHLTDVSHSIDYPGTEDHSKYLKDLKERHFQIFRRRR